MFRELFRAFLIVVMFSSFSVVISGAAFAQNMSEQESEKNTSIEQSNPRDNGSQLERPVDLGSVLDSHAHSDKVISPLKSSTAPAKENSPETSQAIKVVLGLTILGILPAILVSITAFLRIIVVLSMLRHAIGMPETPPNSALIGIALFFNLVYDESHSPDS